MIRKTRSNFGLSGLVDSIPFLDTTEYADFTFQIYEFPSVLGLGRNAFTISANSDYLADNSEILIDIEDRNGEPIYHEITPIINRDRTRTIAVYIYPETPIGTATIYIAGTLKRNIINGTEINERDRATNVLWRRDVLVTTSDATKAKPLFSTPPEIRYSEKTIGKRVATGTRLTLRPCRNFDKLTLKSVLSPANLTTDRFNRDIDLDLDTFYPMVPISNGEGISNGPVPLSKNSYSTITVTNYEFSSSMRGGEIIIKNITASNIPTNTDDTFNPPNYSASIIDVINESTIQVFPPWSYSKTYTTRDEETRIANFDTILNSENFTASFLNTDKLNSNYSESYLRLEYSGIKPDVGTIDALKLSMREIGAIGPNQELGVFPLRPENLLTDPDQIRFDADQFHERAIGDFYSTDSPLLFYWSSSLNGSVSASYQQSNTNIADGLSIRHNGISKESDYILLQPQIRFAGKVTADSEYVLEFQCAPLNTTGSTPQLDVYISGVSISYQDAENIKYPSLTAYENRASFLTNIGDFLGTVIQNPSQPARIRLPFRAQSTGIATPIFAIRRGQWDIGKIRLIPNSDRGYNCESGKIYVPLNQSVFKNEVDFFVEYADSFGQTSNITTKLAGLYFTGSESQYLLQDVSRNYLVQNFNASGNNWNRINHYGGTNLNNAYPEFGSVYSSSLGESSLVKFITQTYVSQSDSVESPVVLRFPVFRDNRTGAVDTGSTGFASYAIEVETTIFGKTGSFPNLEDAYTWASTYQVRAICSGLDDSGIPYLYNPLVISGSDERILGTYGTPPKDKVNLDDWLTYINTSVSAETINIEMQLRTTSSFYWDFYLTSTCKVIKFAGKI